MDTMLLEDSNGIIWMGSGPIAQEGVIRFNGKSITSSKPNGDGWIRYMIEDKNGQIWFGGRSNGNFFTMVKPLLIIPKRLESVILFWLIDQVKFGSAEKKNGNNRE